MNNDDVFAVISDVHGNLAALREVLADIHARGVFTIYCLGDTVDSGPNPRECLDLVMHSCVWMLKGNHEAYVLGDDSRAPKSRTSRQSTRWTKKQLGLGQRREGEANKYESFLEGLPQRIADDSTLFVHGSPVEPTHGYLFPPGYKDDAEVATSCFAKIDAFSFQGHTHMAVVFREHREAIIPQGDDFHVDLEPKMMINVGAVGQPRDYDYRACYVLVRPREASLTYHRVPYPVKETAKQIEAIPELDDRLARRLYKGR